MEQIIPATNKILYNDSTIKRFPNYDMEDNTDLLIFSIIIKFDKEPPIIINTNRDYIKTEFKYNVKRRPKTFTEQIKSLLGHEFNDSHPIFEYNLKYIITCGEFNYELEEAVATEIFKTLELNIENFKKNRTLVELNKRFTEFNIE